ncbi:MAG: peptide ABC transporter substrate-binding protein [Chloroflexi bacterium]|nr:peptide ABC transporter substrate-binding protein [Chloroflexota bacterium]
MTSSRSFFHRFRWQLLLALMAAIAVAFLLWGQQPSGTTPASVAPAPKRGGVYTEALIGSLSRLNPLLDSGNQPDRDVDRLLYCRLVQFDATGLPQPGLAESWGISQDGTTYNVALRTDALWHDGQPVTADDVLFTVELLRSDALPIPPDIRALWKAVTVKKFDDHTLQFHLPEPFAPFLDYLSFGILPKHIWEDVPAEQMVNAPQNLEPVGCGPYRFDRLVVEDGQIQGVALKAFDDYFDGRPYIDRVVFRYYPTAEAALQAYRDGEVLGIQEITNDILQSALREPNLNFYTTRLPRMTIIFFNLGNKEVGFLQDKVVRQALYLGLNRQWMIDHVLNGQALEATGPIFPGTWAYYDKLHPTPYDPDKAIAMLKEAKYVIPAGGGNVREKDGQPLAFTLVYPDDAQHQALAEAIQHDWQQLGVGVTLQAVSYEKLLADYLEPRTYEVALVDLDFSRSPDPDPYPFWHQTQATNGQNYSMWNNRRASEYLEQARITPDITKRQKLYYNFQVLFEKELPALPLFYPVYTYAVDAQVGGIRLGPVFDLSDRFRNITQWYLVARPKAAPLTTESVTTTPTP